jgi:trigger factor
VNVTREKTENCQAYLTIELEPAEVEKALETSYRRLVNKTNVPGFRKGKTPRAVLERYLGKDSLLDEALNTLVPEAYANAIKEQEIEAIAQPSIEITQTDPLVFKAIVPLRPTVELGDFRNIRVTPEPVTVTEDDINAVIEQLRHQQATWEPVERTAESGDMVILDIESSIDGEPFFNREDAQFKLVPEAVFPAPGFSAEIAGAAVDEEREFQIELTEDYPREELRGKTASFKVKIKEIKQEILPELTDEFAKAINQEYQDLDALREQVTANLKQGAEEKARADLEEKVVKAVAEVTQVDFPPILVESEIDRMINQQLQRWQMTDKLEEYLRIINKTNEELRDELRPLATERVTNALILGEVAEKEKVEASDTEVDAEVDNMMKNVTENTEEFGKFLGTPESREAIRRSLVTRKTVQLLVDITTKDSGKEA